MLSSDQPSAPDQTGAPTGSVPTIPGHQLLRRIANGSYGEIWLARTELGAFRAVKIIRRANFSNAKPFDREFAGIQRYEPISREHEGLVDVLQVGQDEAAGFFYYIMELADDANRKPEAGGQRSAGSQKSDGGGQKLVSAFRPLSSGLYTPLALAQAIHERQRLPVCEVIKLGISLARALEFLHSRRLVHRDIKPSNIIFVGGQPKLADVGLVADLGGPQTLVGTEGYIPPEGPGSAQADIYSLGKVLYEAATGNDRQEFPDLALRLGEAPDEALLELNEVLLKACESNPRARYATASTMAADLERLQAGQSLRLRRARQRRLRTSATATALLAGIVIVGIVLAALIQYERTKPRLLFRDDFDGPGLDTNRWTWAHKDWFEESRKGTPTSLVEQTGGELALHAKVEQMKDSISEGVWVDLQHDFRQSSPCRIEISLSGSTLGGLLAVALTTGDAPTNCYDFAGERLLHSMAGLNQTNVWQARRMRVDILSASQTAIVYPDANHTNEFDVVDLRTLAAWHLRFFIAARASETFRTGESDLRIESIVVWSQPDDDRIIGRVVEELSGSPIAGVAINDAEGKLIVRTMASGAFVITRPPRGLLTVEKSDYTNSSVQLLSGGGRSSFATVVLSKTNFVRGDVVEVFPYGNLEVMDIAFRVNTLVMLVDNSETNYGLNFADLESRNNGLHDLVRRKLEFEPGFFLSSIAECGKRVVGINHWPGTMYDLDLTPPHLLLALTNQDKSPINWPTGCAFDGELLWFLESDISRENHRLLALDLTTLKVLHSLDSKAHRMQGLAWDGEQFWISTEEGRVFVVNRDDAVLGRTVEAGLGPEFRGNYHRLTYGQGYLWGLQPAKRRICKIKITD